MTFEKSVAKDFRTAPNTGCKKILNKIEAISETSRVRRVLPPHAHRHALTYHVVIATLTFIVYIQSMYDKVRMGYS